jgi:outer membrane protein TolC
VLLPALLACLLCASCAVPEREYGRAVSAGLARARALKRIARAAPAPEQPAASDDEEDEAELLEPLPKKLTLREAFLRTLLANKDVRVTELIAQADEARILGAEGEFDATLFAEASRGRTNTPVAGVPLGRTNTSDGAFTAGLRKRSVTGTDVALSASTDYTRDLTGTATLDPQYAPELLVTVSQDLLRDFGVDINRTDIVVSQNNWRISEEALRNSLIQNLFAVERAYWDLYFAVADLRVREAQLQRALRLVERAEAQVDVGMSAPIEVTRAKSSAAAQEVAILEARNLITRLRHRLLREMGVLDVTMARRDFELADAPPQETHRTSLLEAVKVALKWRPDYVQSLLGIENAELLERFFKNQRLPTVQAFGEFSMTALDDEFGASTGDLQDGRFDSWTAGLLFEWPFPNRVARSDYMVARLQRRQAKVLMEAVIERITRDVGDALDDLRTAEGRIETATEARHLAEELLTAEEKSFSLGRSNGLDVLDAQAALAAAERDEARARADYATALSNLFRVQGDFLERKAIPFVGRPGH